MKKDSTSSRPHLDLHLQQLEDFFYIFDTQKRFTYVNPSLLELWNKTLPEVLGKNFFDLGYPQDLVSLHEDQLNRALSGKIVNGENEFTGPDGITNYYEYTFVPVIDAQQRVTAIAGTTRNITARKRIESKLIQSEQYFRTYAEAMPQMAFIADTKGEILYFNKPWYDYVQKDGTEGWGWKSKDIHHPDDLLSTIERWNLSLQTGIPYECEYRLRRHDGVYLWHLGRALPLKDENGHIILWVGTNTDIDEQKTRADKMVSDFNQLSDYNQILKDQKLSRESLIAGISHDLRTPLTSAKINSELLFRKSSDDEVKRIASRITTSMERADRMIRDILDVSRMEAGKKLNMTPTTFCLNAFLEDLIEDYRTIYGDRFRIAASELITGTWDEDMLKRIMENLINNSLKYGDAIADISFTIKLSDLKVEIAVHNLGHPISAEDKLHLFNAFERSSSAESQTKMGWGIGLTLIRGLCQLMNGQIEVASEALTGTTFTVTLPLSIVALEEEI